MYQYKELININKADNIDKQCQDIITNWEIVCEENDYHRDYVTDHQWKLWVEKRDETNSKIIDLSTAHLGEIYDFLMNLNSQIHRATRRDVRAEAEQKQQEESLESQAYQIERSAKPSKGLLDKMMFWR